LLIRTHVKRRSDQGDGTHVTIVLADRSWKDVRVRVLIVGAGVAGLTVAARLAQQGREPVVVERSEGVGQGYALGLYPLGSCVLHGINAYDELIAAGHAVETYVLADGAGRRLLTMGMQVLTDGVGPTVMVSRADLLELLERAAAVPVRRGTTVRDLEQDSQGVDVTFGDGGTDRFDLVVACDGIGSQTRGRIFGPQPGFDAGWVLWTWWVDSDLFDPAAFREFWGRGWFLGVYPCSDQTMCAAGGPTSHFATRGIPDAPGNGAAVAALLRERLQPLAGVDASVAGAIDGLEASCAYAWPMRDVRSRHWSAGRIALCGDAAVAFLPTAGVGASNALRAAAALADELSRSDGSSIPLGLELYEKRCRSVVERNQTDSRRLARLMFVRSKPIGWARDHLARRYPPERVLGHIIDSAHQPF
jgi:2-polyprenyl-6-methoxyphenol hydroxylase-like FAD-dependent oxidoreductase